MKMKYTVVYEKSEDGYGAYVPDLPGCAAVGDTLEETERLVAEAIAFHIEVRRRSNRLILSLSESS